MCSPTSCPADSTALSGDAQNCRSRSRLLGARGGLNVSASHNPPDDNGGKFYDERGGQPVPPEDQIMSDFVDQVEKVRFVPFDEAHRSGKVIWLEDVPHKKYVDLCRKQALTEPPRLDEIRIVFTPLHGVGAMGAMEAMQAHGFRPIAVESQMEPNGQFPNVTKSPNPEVPACFDRAEEVGAEHKAHLLMATDPDADRIGGEASLSLDGGAPFHFITGNEISAILTHYKLATLAKQKALPQHAIVVKTEVTTGLVSRIARKYNAQVVENLLVGFKFIAEVIHQLDSTGRYEEVTGTPADFIIGSEESHGVLTTPLIRDKDAGGAAVLLAEMALEQKRQGRTVPQYLAMIAEEFGYFRNEVANILMPGVEGKSDMMRMLESMRKNPPQTIAGLKLESFEDLRDPNGRMGPIKGATDAAGRNFLIFRLAETDGLSARVALRPSGTEPKAKAYVEVSTAPRGHMNATDWPAKLAEADALARKIGAEFVEMATRAGKKM